MKKEEFWKDILKKARKPETRRALDPIEKKKINRVHYIRRQIQRDIDKLLKKNPIRSSDVEQIHKKHSQPWQKKHN